MNSDFRELLSILDRHGVRHLVVGGYAVMVYTEPRFTKDLDVFIGTTEDDVERFRAALQEFGFPMTEQAVSDLREPNRMISVGP
ncbi:MAG: nucleotidyltransferase, partial [Proteobacteria bacterium]|nr:nucleotidyltransferase [Pseudomonadota bacterium]